MLGVVGIPCVGLTIAIVFNYCYTGTFLFSCEKYTTFIKDKINWIKHKYKEYKERQIPHETVYDTKGKVWYYRNDGLTRDFSPLTP